jgi:acyl transferase domain-containing protein
MPWVEDHKINGSMIYPGAGMLVMAIEAANQIAIKDHEIEGFELEDVHFISTLGIPRNTSGMETQLYVREIRDVSSSETSWSEFRLFCFENEDWVENCRGAIRVQYKDTLDSSNDGSFTKIEKIREVETCLARESSIPDSYGHIFEHGQLYSRLRGSGYDFGPYFQLIRNGVFVNKKGRRI